MNIEYKSGIIGGALKVMKDGVQIGRILSVSGKFVYVPTGMAASTQRPFDSLAAVKQYVESTI